MVIQSKWFVILLKRSSLLFHDLRCLCINHRLASIGQKTSNTNKKRHERQHADFLKRQVVMQCQVLNIP